jgi:hypothetical protein
MGQSLFNLQMGNQQCGIEAVIADLAIDGILGLDFVQRYNCLIDLRGNVLCFVNEELPLYIEGQIGYTQTRNLAGTSFIFKSMYIPASLLEVLTPKYARFWLRLCFLLLVLSCVFYWSFLSVVAFSVLVKTTRSKTIRANYRYC